MPGSGLVLPARMIPTLARTVTADLSRRWRTYAESTPLARRFAHGALWSVTGSIGARSLTLVASVLMARLLGKADFGALSVIQHTTGMFAVFAGFGLGVTATRYVAQWHQDSPERAGRIVALVELIAAATGMAMALLLAAAAPSLATGALEAPELTRLLQLGGVILFFNALSGANLGALAGLEAFRRAARATFIANLIALPLQVAATALAGVSGAVCGLVVASLLNWVMCHHAVRSAARRMAVPISFRGATAEIGILWRFSLPAVMAGLMGPPVYWITSVLLVRQPDGYSEMGVFGAVNQWFMLLQFVPQVLGQAVLPLLSRAVSDGRHDDAVWLLRAASRLIAVVVVPVALLGSFASPLIVRLYGPDFADAWPILTVVLITGALVAIQAPAGQAVAATGRMWLGALMNLGWALLFLGSAAVFVRWGALGLASARLLAYVLHCGWSLAFVLTMSRQSCTRSQHA